MRRHCRPAGAYHAGAGALSAERGLPASCARALPPCPLPRPGALWQPRLLLSRRPLPFYATRQAKDRRLCCLVPFPPSTPPPNGSSPPALHQDVTFSCSSRPALPPSTTLLFAALPPSLGACPALRRASPISLPARLPPAGRPTRKPLTPTSVQWPGPPYVDCTRACCVSPLTARPQPHGRGLAPPYQLSGGLEGGRLAARIPTCKQHRRPPRSAAARGGSRALQPVGMDWLRRRQAASRVAAARAVRSMASSQMTEMRRRAGWPPRSAWRRRRSRSGPVEESGGRDTAREWPTRNGGGDSCGVSTQFMDFPLRHWGL
jgi:hypothetical protein